MVVITQYIYVENVERKNIFSVVALFTFLGTTLWFVLRFLDQLYYNYESGYGVQGINDELRKFAVGDAYQ